MSKENQYLRERDLFQRHRTHREMSVQACPGVSFVNSNLLEKRFQVFRSEDKMQNMPGDEMCFAEFLSNCCVDIKNKEFNNTEPTVLNKLGRGVLVDDSINSENLS